MAELTPAQKRAAEIARIKAENEARKQRVAGNQAPTPASTPAPTPKSTVSQEQQAKAIESLVTLAISGGTDEDVKRAVEAVQKTTQPTTAPTSVPKAESSVSPTPEQIKSVENLLTRAISGGTEEDVDTAIKALENLKNVEEQKPSPTLEAQQEQKKIEDLVVRAISGGTQEDVDAAIKAVEELKKVQGVVDTGQDADQGEGAGQSAGQGTGQGIGQGEDLTDEGNAATVDKGAGTKEGTGAGAGFTASDGTKFTDQKSYQEYQDYLDDKRTSRQSAFDLLYEQFSQYGLGSLVEPLRSLIKDPSVSASEFTIRLRQSDPYKKRFAANQSRIDRGLAAISEAEYLSLEDQYQNIMRNYGLPESFYRKDTLGTQKGFESLIGFDVSAAELEDRIQSASNRVLNAAPEVKKALVDFYPGITDGDILGYVLDPQNALTEIKRKITSAEIGAGAMQAGLRSTLSRAEELQRFGITGEEARRGFQAVAEIAPRGSQLAEFYKETPYTQQTAETEVFGITGAAEARRKRERLTQREQATFSGSSGAFQGALSRDRQGAF